MALVPPFRLARLPAVVALALLSGIIVGIGTLLCVIPGIYFYVAFAVAVPVLLVEGAGPSRALGRSRELVRGRWVGDVRCRSRRLPARLDREPGR
jgi:hypothetical protein